MQTTIIIGVIIGVLGYLFRSRLERIERDIEILKKEQQEFKDNYLDRFEKVNKNINDSKLEIMKELNKLYIRIEGK